MSCCLLIGRILQVYHNTNSLGLDETSTKVNFTGLDISNPCYLSSVLGLFHHLSLPGLCVKWEDCARVSDPTVTGRDQVCYKKPFAQSTTSSVVKKSTLWGLRTTVYHSGGKGLGCFNPHRPPTRNRLLYTRFHHRQRSSSTKFSVSYWVVQRWRDGTFCLSLSLVIEVVSWDSLSQCLDSGVSRRLLCFTLVFYLKVTKFGEYQPRRNNKFVSSSYRSDRTFYENGWKLLSLKSIFLDLKGQ